MTKEIHDINTRALDFVVELIEYIFEYPDDDYMTMECLCRKLHKHELIAKVDGHWQPLDKRCEDCIFVEGSHWCDGCDKTPKGMKEYDEYWAKAERKTEPTISKMEQVEDEPQTDDKCKGCKWWNKSYGCHWKEGVCHYVPKAIIPQQCVSCDSASRIIEAYSRGFEDGAEAVKSIKIKALHKDYIEPYVTIEDEPITQMKTQNSNFTFEKADEPQTDCAWK